jgi:hypothetical protein
MKIYAKVSTLTSLLLMVVLMSLNLGAAPSAGKPPTATPSGPTATPGGPTATPGSGPANITVSGTPMGTSSCYLGANEGSSDFNINDFTDLGINTYRIYGGMSRWEPVDDDGVYGSPTIAAIKANVNVINWATWDNIMTNPPSGTDYHWSDVAGWQGNARTLFSALKTAGVKPVVVLRNVDNGNKPAWAAALNPPNTPEDNNEWWEHVFATVYWFNVRNNYQVDDWAVHNEPNNGGQGWGGTITDYYAFVQQTNDAIQYVYATYLPGRTPHVFAPGTTSGSSWPRDVMANAGAYFDSVDIHNYDANIDTNDQTAHGWMDTYGFATAPLWITESGSWHENKYGSASGVNSMFIANWIRGSKPGNVHVYGNHIFSMYDWTTWGSGFIAGPGANGTKLAGYYAVRIAIRGLGPCRPTYQATTSSGLAIATKDSAGKVYLLVNGASGTLTADLSALITSGTGTMWQFDATHNDVIVGNPVLSNGRVTFTAPGSGGTVLLKF